MGIYAVGMISIVVLSTLALIYILKRNNMLGFNLLAAIVISSIAICFGIPFVFSKLNQGLSLIISLLVTAIIYITLVLVVTVAISLLITEKKANAIWNKISKNKSLLAVQEFIVKTMDTIRGRSIKFNIDGFKEIDNKKLEIDIRDDEAAACDEQSHIGESILEQEPIINDLAVDFVEDIVQSSVEQGENIIEKSVDTEQNIDKMGIETVNMDISSVSDENGIEEDSYTQTDIIEELLDKNSLENINTIENVENNSEAIDTKESSSVEETDSIVQEFVSDHETNEEESSVELNYSMEDIGDPVLQEEQEVVAVIEEHSEEQTSSLVCEGIINSGDEEDNIVNASISGETWTLQSEQSVDNIYFENINDLSDSNVDQEEKNLDINDYIDEAFRLKESGDIEGAILHYMYALDKRPEKDVVFWIVLDTCVLYKELGQVELAREILESYVSTYGDVMSLSVRTEIERNLFTNED